MVDDMNERRMLALMVLLAIWAAAWGYSVVLLLKTPDVSTATLPWMQRTVGFIGWQGVAGIFGFACWGVGWSLPKGSGIRRISVLPLWTALGFILVMVGMSVLGR